MTAIQHRAIIAVVIGAVTLTLLGGRSWSEPIYPDQKCQFLSSHNHQNEVMHGSFRFSSTTEREHTYTFNDDSIGDIKRWRIDKYGKMKETKNHKDLAFKATIRFTDEPETVCIMMYLYDHGSNKHSVNKSKKSAENIPNVQWAYIIDKKKHGEEPIILMVLFEDVHPSLSDKPKLFDIKAALPVSGDRRWFEVSPSHGGIVALELEQVE